MNESGTQGEVNQPRVEVNPQVVTGAQSSGDVRTDRPNEVPGVATPVADPETVRRNAVGDGLRSNQGERGPSVEPGTERQSSFVSVETEAILDVDAEMDRHWARIQRLMERKARLAAGVNHKNNSITTSTN